AIFLGIWGMFVISGVDNVLKPYLISRGGNLPLVVVLLGVFGGVLAFGFMGLFLGPTLLAVAYSVLGDWVAKEVPEVTAPEKLPGEGLEWERVVSARRSRKRRRVSAACPRHSRTAYSSGSRAMIRPSMISSGAL